MVKHSQAVLFALVAAVAATAQAADDDDLTPLTPIKKQPAKAPPPAKKAPPPPAKKAPPPPVRKASGDDDLAPLTPVTAKGDLSVRVAGQVSRATLLIDGKELGVLPMAPQSLSTGEHLVTVRRVGYAAFVKKVVIANGRSLELEAKLTPVAAVLSVSSDVSDAQVFVNGRLIGPAPIVDYEVPPGTVELTVLKEGFHEDKQKVTLVAGKDYPVVVKFSPPPVIASDRPVQTTLVPTTTGQEGVTAVAPAPGPPIYQRWYFWVGIGVAVAAVAAGTAVGITAAQKPSKYAPGEVCQLGHGPCDATLGF